MASCEACGSDRSDDARFCGVCGVSVARAAAVPVPGVAVGAGPPPVPGEPWNRGGPFLPGAVAAAAPATPPALGAAPNLPLGVRGTPAARASLGVPGGPPGGGIPPGDVTVLSSASKRSGVVRVLAVVFASSFLAVAVFTAYNFAFAAHPPAELSIYMAGKGVEWTVPRTHSTVRLPAQPKVASTHPTVLGKVVNGTTATVVRGSYEIMVVALDGFGKVDAAKETPLLDGALRDSARAFHVDITKTRATTQSTGILRVAAHGAFHGETVEAVITHEHGRMFVLFVHARSGAAGVLAALEKSLRVA